jgi:hypothetical protein
MASIEEQVLRTAKEIVVKFIEIGRVSPTGFEETFTTVHQAVHRSVKELASDPITQKEMEPAGAKKKKKR